MKDRANHSDAELITLLNRGDKKAFEIIYNTYAPELYSYARHIITRKEDCEEMIQEVFERLWSLRKSIQPKPLRPYLYTSVRNKLTDYFRHNAIKKRYAEHYLFFETIYDSIDEEHTAENIQRAIEQGIRQLPERAQVAIRLRLNENLSNAEIAQRMNITHRTVDNYMTSVYNHFRKTYGSFCRVGASILIFIFL